MWNVLFWILLSFLFLLLVILFAPMHLDALVSYMGSEVGAKVSLSYLHPALFFFSYSTNEGISHVRIFGRVLKYSNHDKPQPPDFDSPEKAFREELVGEIPQSGQMSEEDPEIPAQPETPPSPDSTFRMDNSQEDRNDERGGERRSFLQKIRENRFFYLIKNTRWRAKIFTWLKSVGHSLLRVIRFDCFRLEARMGLKDPARLGELYGYFLAMRSALELRSRGVDLRVEPVFMQNHLEFTAELGLRTSVHSLLSPFMVALFTMPYLSTYKLWRESNGKGK